MNFAIWFISSLPMIILWVILCVAVVKITKLILKRHDDKIRKAATFTKDPSKEEPTSTSMENPSKEERS